MKYNNDFSHDLEVGQLGEKALANILENKRVEVKTDLQAKDTGNVFVEFHSRGKPSGIATSNAEYWAFIISSTQIIIIETEKLKALCRQYFHSRATKGGDSDTSRGVLLPIEALVLT